MSAGVDLYEIEPSTDYDFEDADRLCGARANGGLDTCTVLRLGAITATAVASAFMLGRFVGGRRLPAA